MGVKEACDVEVTYISVGCNRSPLCVDWSPHTSSSLCFGAAHAVTVARFDTEVNGSTQITHNLAKHTAKVNSVRWIRSSGNSCETDEDSIISGSSDNTAIIWRKLNDNYSPAYFLTEHKSAVTVVDARYINQQDAIILYAATASVDSTIRIWLSDQTIDEMSCSQTISLGTGLCLALQFTVLPNTSIPLLAIGLDDDKIHLFAQTLDNMYNKTFKKLLSLIGHEDWIRGIDFVTLDSKLMLATCSQDTYIRLWSIEAHIEKGVNEDKLEIKKELFTVDDTSWAVTLDAVLSGHEGWVYGVHWNIDRVTKKMKLLSASIDKSLILWEPTIVEGREGIWTETVRVGEVGGSNLGFYGGKLSYNGCAIIGHSYTGSFHLWKYKEETSSWEPSVVCGGHFSQVVDIAWEPDGEFLISASTDQTTRVHSPWIRNLPLKTTWHEIARPQIHGFDISCLAVVSKYCYASGAEEKVIRVFQAPKNFIRNFCNITGKPKDEAANPEDENTCQGASVPSLGLSNKAVYTLEEAPSENKHIKDQYPTNYFVPVNLKDPPTEETLMQNTLWPETNKLYGHGYEVFSLAASPDGKILASACKATNVQHAAVLVWDTSSWVQKQSLPSHNLTIAQLAFSPDSSMLLSVSRDRRWSVFQKSPEDGTFSLIGCSDKTNGIHTRIIWCCAWTHDSINFLTGSRDGKVVIWEKGDVNSNKSTGPFRSHMEPLELKSQSVTAVAAGPVQKDKCYLTAVGLECGIISLYKIFPIEKTWVPLVTLDRNIAHHLTVRRIMFKPSLTSEPLQLASCSDDHSVKLYTIRL